MSNNSGASSSSSSSSAPFPLSSRVSIQKTIQHIKEITSNQHSEEDIYAMLKECSMDPNETTQRLLLLDTFHEVKRKRDKRKESVKSRSGEESRWKPGHQGRGTRNARGNAFSQYTSNDSGGRRTAAIRKENGVEESKEKSFRPSSASVSKEVDSTQPHNFEKSSSIIVNEPPELPNGSRGVQSSRVVETYPLKENIKANANNLSTVVPKASAQYAPSASDPVLVPSCDSWVTAVGAIKQELHQHISGEISTLVPAGSGLGTTNSVNDNHLNQHEPQNVDSSQVSSSISEKQSFELVEVAHPKICRECPVAEKSHVIDSVQVMKPSSPQGVKDAAAKLDKLKFSDGQCVIIPQHIQVPDAVKNVLSFGSLDASFGVSESCVNSESNENSNAVADSAHEESSCEHNVVSTASEANSHADHLQSPMHLPGKNSPIDTEGSATLAKDDQPKQENFPAVGPPFPVVQTNPSYSFGFMPPMLANVLVQPEGFESQAHVSYSLGGSSLAVSTSASTPPLTHSVGAGQSSIAVSPQPTPLFRQPYPVNYIPYSHYFPPFYVPPAMHQYFGHTAFPPPLPTSNVYFPSQTAASGVKSSPAHFKPGSDSVNQAPVGLSTGYGAYCTSPVGYSQNAAVTSVNSSNGEDLVPPAQKENNIYPGQQTEGSTVWLPAAGRDNASFPLSSFLNLPPQGHHLLNPQSGHGTFAIYQAMQPMGSPAPGLPLLQQSQPVAGSVESVGLPSNCYQQPQRQQQINWNM